MSDLINRQDAIDAIRASTSKYTGFMEMEMYTDDDAVEAIEGVPSAQQWIPCSERLPEIPDGYPHSELRRSYFLVSLKSGCVESLGFDFDEMRWHVTGSPVLAWMPLPKPWKGE